jgi:hypothetical protein
MFSSFSLSFVVTEEIVNIRVSDFGIHLKTASRPVTGDRACVSFTVCLSYDFHYHGTSTIDHHHGILLRVVDAIISSYFFFFSPPHKQQ